MSEIGKEYGTALFLLACEENRTGEYAGALETVKGVFSENPEYLALLASPGISLEERLSMIRSAFENSVPEYVLSYLQLLCEKGRIAEFFVSAEEYLSLWNASKNVSNARVISAVPLTEEEKQALCRKLEETRKGTVRPEFSVDPSLLGGIVVEMDGTVLDGSLRRRLRDVKEVMSL